MNLGIFQSIFRAISRILCRIEPVVGHQIGSTIRLNDTGMTGVVFPSQNPCRITVWNDVFLKDL
jgi:hypothetical protein